MRSPCGKAPDPQTLEITDENPIAEGALSQLAYFVVLPKHVWRERVGEDGKACGHSDPRRSPPYPAVLSP